MVRWSRYAFALVVWLFLIGVVVQTLYAGLGLFDGAANLEVHVGLGWTLHLVPILVLIAAALGRVGRGTLMWSVALLLTVGIQPFLPGFRTSVPVLAALHPVNALLIFGVTALLARRSLDLVRGDAATVPAARTG
jgi:Family of unknown function (DUF6220)